MTGEIRIFQVQVELNLQYYVSLKYNFIYDPRKSQTEFFPHNDTQNAAQTTLILFTNLLLELY